MQLYISHEREAKLRSYAKSKGVSLSSIIGDWVDKLDSNFIPAIQNIVLKEKDNLVKCNLPFCKSMAIGKFETTVPDSIEGEIKTVRDLCALHKTLAGREGTVKAV